MKTLITISILLTSPPLFGESAKSKAYKATAKYHCSLVSIALKEFISDHNGFPVDVDKEKDIKCFTNSNLISVIDGTNKDKNSKGKRYFYLKEELLGKHLKDPWGNEYIVLLDTNGDGKVSYRGTVKDAKMVVYSLGPDGIESADDILKSQ